MEPFTPRTFAPVAPLQVAPAGPYATLSECEAVLADTLRGVELGGYDELVCAQLVSQLNMPMLRALVSLFERVRTAGILDAVDAEAQLRSRHPKPAHHHVDRGIASVPPRDARLYLRVVPGNASPDFPDGQ